MAQAQGLSYIINHVFLPPKLPQEDDSGVVKDSALIVECEAALKSFRAHLPSHKCRRWAACTRMLRNMLELRDPSGDMISEKVEATLESMADQDVLAFHIRGQNAGLVVRKLGEQISFESFELSPTTQAVMGTKGRLERCFPGPAIAISQERMADSFFREALVQLLTRLDVDTPQEAWPVVSKAQSKSIEVRDTVHPKFITEMLTGILRGIGQPFDVLRIYKRTRDDVLWDRALKPWRRSPLWLLLRVALQTSLATREYGDHMSYKSFMVFFMARILQRSLQASLPSDLLFVMAAKISRRTLKLALGDEPSWMQDIRSSIEASHRELATRWSSIEQNPYPFRTQEGWDSSAMSFCQDTGLSLLKLRPYLQAIATREAAPGGHHIFTSGCRQRIKQCSSSFPELDHLEAEVDTRLCLVDLELWVQDCLTGWLDVNLDSQHTCTLLAELVGKYTKVAGSTYAGNPEAVSLMLLTSMDLWVALDKCAIRHYPLLRKYNPEFPPSLFDPLLLPKRPQMERLSSVEQYLLQRRNQATPGFPSIFQGVNTTASLAVQYFEQSHHHQVLRQRIELAAQAERDCKRNELRKMRQKYQELMWDSNARTCDYEIHWERRRQVSRHSSGCRKCQLKSTANSLQITVHEWPLPLGELAVKSAVFELEVPTPIAKWRDTTYGLLVDIFSPAQSRSQRSSKEKVYTMNGFNGLNRYFKSQPARLQLASTAKPFVEAHYRSQHVPQATEESICVNNGLIYSMYDSKSRQWTKDLLGRCDVRRICTLQLPPGPYRKLQFALDGTTHTSNEVLAMQSECPRSLNLHEFYAFATLRSGNRLQWRNIARELVPRVLNFSSEETYMLVVQAAWQVGPSGGGQLCRESHIDLEEEKFGMSLLLFLEEALGAVEGNWQGVEAVRTFIALAARLLSLSPFEKVRNRCSLLLRRAREVTLRWTREVGRLLHESEDAEESKTLNIRVLEMALTCHGTFDVDQCQVSEMLSSAGDIAAITECSITVHDRCPAVTGNLPQPVKTLLQRFMRLSHLLESALRERILADRQGIDRTVYQLWAGYRPGSLWTALKSPSQRWLVTQTTSEGGYSPVSVHYNTLDGSLLVKGKPLARLPRHYELHTTYCRLFGEKVLDVVPSTMSGMDFETRNELCGQQVHFAMYGSELIIRTRRQEQVCEVLPLHSLQGDFPRALVQDYAHWFEVSTGSVEWRPLARVWTPSPDNWLMQADSHGTFVLGHGAKALVDLRSPTAKSISHVLSPLEHATHIHIILNHETGGLEVQLPRLKLDFLLKDCRSLLESKQFRGMVVDERQSFGTLTGLVNKLVLREIEGSSRSVIIPYGKVSFLPDGYHVRVMIGTAAAIHVKYHSYSIDIQLGRLVDNGSLQSRLFRLYLHATTAHCLIDQLTGRTGTEEALDGLAGAATRSFVELEPADVELLEMLARLTPRRQYYPDHLRVMQQVEWEKLSPLSQHCAFYQQVISVLSQAKLFHVFQGQPAQLPISDTRGEQDLLERAAIRDSSFQVHGFGAESYTTDYDIVYASRDQVLDRTRELQTYRTAKLVDDWSTNLVAHSQLLSEVESWGEPIRGPGYEDDLTVGFDLKWLDAPAKFLPDDFCTLQHIFSRSVVEWDKYKIMILLSTLSYSRHAKQELVQTLLAFATIPGLRALQPPSYAVFQLSEGYEPVQQKLISLVEGHIRQFYECPECDLPSLPSENWYLADERRRDRHRIAKEEQVGRFVDDLILQWPEADISIPPDVNHSTYISVDAATRSARTCFQSWHRNAHFKSYIGQTQIFLSVLPTRHENLEEYSFSLPLDGYVSRRAYVNFDDLTRNPAPRLPLADKGAFDTWLFCDEKGNADHTKLKQLLARVSSRCSSGHEQRYAGDLVKSFEALREETSVELKPPEGLSRRLRSHLEQAQRHVDDVYKVICSSLQAGTWNAVRNAHLLPRVSKTSILSLLASDKIGALPLLWKVSLVQYGLSITTLQRAERLLASARNMAELLAELKNPGHRDWDPMDFPQWLLLEIENNILIRQDQAQISREMMSPSSGSNSVMQLNMGLGKSSVIVPIAAAALADKTQLVRIVVLKPLAMQMFQLLRKKLGGLLNRRIFYMPISRSLNLDIPQALQVRDLLEECMRTGGMILVQPEHILSFELMGFERLLSGNTELGNILIRTQDWLRVYSRDILDESDEILSVRFELIYTMGMQRAIEFSPDRWAIIQYVLRLVSRCTHQVLDLFPHGLEVISAQPGSFPRVRILEARAGDVLLRMVARQVCDNGVPGVPVWSLPQSIRSALFEFLTDPTWGATATQSLQKFAAGSESVKKGLLLLKGLFAIGVLKFCLEQKRWRVHYGLDPSRTMLAVPYHAKDSPALRAEFSHPDATIVLTCLSYYYGGLSDQQIHASFEALLQSDHAAEEYAYWVQDAPQLPMLFRQLTGINLSNTGQCCREVFPPLRFAVRVVNFYMSTIVFPTEMKEFPHKLSSSGWDIAREKGHLTTGFSGTNDSRYILPLSISQCDLPPQLSTNAAVLDCLLRPENSVVDICQASDTGVLDAEVLVKMASTLDPPVRVILDVGAQVLELQNEEMARIWLSRVPDSEAQAAIFFNVRNDICVLSRDGTTEPLQVSPFSKQLDQCLVYLDEAHTRGTDLRMPENYRAIVTLGPGLTKDRLVQACMRMRKLGKGQSVAFCSSMEVHQKILESSGRSHGMIEVADVLQWCIAGTCSHARKSIALWATQGLRHQRRRAACSQPLVNAEGRVSGHLAEYLLEREAQSLQERYGNGAQQHEEQILLHNVMEEPLMGRKQQLADIRAKCREFDVASFNTATLHEEQERELSPENEREQQVELPAASTPRIHCVHPDVRLFIRHGVFERSSGAFRPSFDTLRNTTALDYYESTWPEDLVVTTDFAQTIQASDEQLLDSYLRPVHWIVSCKDGDRINYVVLSPYEAQELLPSIRKHQHVILHVYSPRLNVSARTLEDLSFCTIPAVLESQPAPHIVRQLNLFAGQLYIRNYEEYVLLCGFLGLCSEPPDDHIEVARDGFISPQNRALSNSVMLQECPFTTSPVAFLRMIMALRRKGQSFAMSHFGMILNGELIAKEQF